MNNQAPATPNLFDLLTEHARRRIATMSPEEIARFTEPARQAEPAAGFQPETPVEMCVAVVVSPDHIRFGQVASIRRHDWLEFGQLHLEFDDGHRETFRDGLISEEPVPPEALIFARSEDAAIADLVARLPDLQSRLRRLFHDCYNRQQTWEGRFNHRRNFFAVLNGEEAQQTLPV